jgi:nicotinate phosphoribosyltransferase
MSDPNASVALHTDQYEVGQVQGALHSGVANRTAVFELFARRLPTGRRYGVVAGIGRILDLLNRFKFTERQVRWLEETGVADERTRRYVLNRRFQGDIWAYREGELYFPSSPVLTVRATFGEAILLETLLLGICNWDSGIASVASRMVTAARGRPIIEMGSRRTHEDAAVDAARAAYIAGFAATSNMEAGARYGIPVRGTSAHAFTLAHDSELEAFEAQVATQGPGTTLLVDTYDVE